MHNSSFSPGVAFVAGGSGGIGAAICAALARAGSDVVVGYRHHAAKAEAVAEAVRSTGRHAETQAVDISDSAALVACLASLAQRYGALHTVVGAAGPVVPQRFLSAIVPDEMKAFLAADAGSVYTLVHAALPHLRHAHGSLVVLSSSGVGRWPNKDGLSVIPKAAIEAMIKGVAREEGRYGVRANCVQVGVVNAGQFLELSAIGELPADYVDAVRRNVALQRVGEAADVGEAVAYLASSRAAYVTGQVLCVDGGYAV